MLTRRSCWTQVVEFTMIWGAEMPMWRQSSDLTQIRVVTFKYSTIVSTGLRQREHFMGEPRDLVHIPELWHLAKCHILNEFSCVKMPVSYPNFTKKWFLRLSRLEIHINSCNGLTPNICHHIALLIWKESMHYLNCHFRDTVPHSLWCSAIWHAFCHPLLGCPVVLIKSLKLVWRSGTLWRNPRNFVNHENVSDAYFLCSAKQTVHTGVHSLFI